MKIHLHTDHRGGGDCFDLDVGDTVGVSTNSFGLSPDDQNIGLHISDPAVMRKLADMFLEAAADAMAAQIKRANYCCPAHGGPRADEVRVFQDGYTNDGYPMWCAVTPDFINLQESPAGFNRDPMEAVAALRLEISKDEGQRYDRGH